MSIVHVEISVRGFTEGEARRCLPALLDEFQQRHWLLHPTAIWNTARSCLAIAVDYEGHDATLCGQATLDEVRDCVVTCLQTASNIRFDMDSSRIA
jgi:hypothetical protein